MDKIVLQSSVALCF